MNPLPGAKAADSQGPETLYRAARAERWSSYGRVSEDRRLPTSGRFLLAAELGTYW